jgi:hypothetical protein
MGSIVGWQLFQAVLVGAARSVAMYIGEATILFSQIVEVVCRVAIDLVGAKSGLGCGILIVS